MQRLAAIRKSCTAGLQALSGASPRLDAIAGAVMRHGERRRQQKGLEAREELRPPEEVV